MSFPLGELSLIFALAEPVAQWHPFVVRFTFWRNPRSGTTSETGRVASGSWSRRKLFVVLWLRSTGRPRNTSLALASPVNPDALGKDNTFGPPHARFGLGKATYS